MLMPGPMPGAMPGLSRLYGLRQEEEEEGEEVRGELRWLLEYATDGGLEVLVSPDLSRDREY